MGTLRSTRLLIAYVAGRTQKRKDPSDQLRFSPPEMRQQRTHQTSDLLRRLGLHLLAVSQLCHLRQGHLPLQGFRALLLLRAPGVSARREPPLEGTHGAVVVSLFTVYYFH